MNVTSAFTNSGLIRLDDGAGLAGGAITNTGRIQGDGSISNALTNSSTGSIRVDGGDTLFFTGPFAANAGELNLQGGTLDFAQPLQIAAGGQINGSGVFYAPASPVPSSGNPAAGLNCNGQINLSGDDSLVFGTVAMNAGSRVIASGGHRQLLRHLPP